MKDLVIVAHPGDEQDFMQVLGDKILYNSNVSLIYCFTNDVPAKDMQQYEEDTWKFIREYNKYFAVAWWQYDCVSDMQSGEAVKSRIKDDLQDMLRGVIGMVSPDRIFTHNPMDIDACAQFLHRFLITEYRDRLVFPEISHGAELEGSYIQDLHEQRQEGKSLSDILEEVELPEAHPGFVYRLSKIYEKHPGVWMWPVKLKHLQREVTFQRYKPEASSYVIRPGQIATYYKNTMFINPIKKKVKEEVLLAKEV